MPLVHLLQSDRQLDLFSDKNVALHIHTTQWTTLKSIRRVTDRFYTYRQQDFMITLRSRRALCFQWSEFSRTFISYIFLVNICTLRMLFIFTSCQLGWTWTTTVCCCCVCYHFVYVCFVVAYIPHNTSKLRVYDFFISNLKCEKL